MKNLLIAAPIAIGLCLAACAPSEPAADAAAASAADSSTAVDDEEQGKSRGVGN